MYNTLYNVLLIIRCSFKFGTVLLVVTLRFCDGGHSLPASSSSSMQSQVHKVPIILVVHPLRNKYVVQTSTVPYDFASVR